MALVTVYACKCVCARACPPTQTRDDRFYINVYKYVAIRHHTWNLIPEKQLHITKRNQPKDNDAKVSLPIAATDYNLLH